MAAIESCIFHARLDCCAFLFFWVRVKWGDNLTKAFEMNSFAVENGYSTSKRGSPRGFAAIEAVLGQDEGVIFSWTADGVRDEDKNTLFDGTCAFALTPFRVIFAGRVSGNYVTGSLPYNVFYRIGIRRKGLFGHEAVVKLDKKAVRFGGPLAVLKEIAEGLDSAFRAFV